MILCFFHNRSSSLLNVDRVVNPPIIPTDRMVFKSELGTYQNNNPSSAEPIILIKKVTTGKCKLLKNELSLNKSMSKRRRQAPRPDAIPT